MAVGGLTTALRDQMRSHPDWFTMREQIIETMRLPEVAWLADAIGQMQQWTDEELLAWAHVYALVNTGRVRAFNARVGVGPFADRARELNAASLGGVEAPYVAHLDMEQNAADSDGHFEWVTAVRVGEGSTSYVQEPIGRIQLEVGYSNPSTTYWHLATGRAVARWPYDCPNVVVLIADVPLEHAEVDW